MLKFLGFVLCMVVAFVAGAVCVPVGLYKAYPDAFEELYRSVMGKPTSIRRGE